jgi:ubiquinone/menaquinone biosynthesis C-methylase UbiE
MERYYDKKQNRLVYIRHSASKSYWDAHWEGNYYNAVTSEPNSWVVKITKQYLSLGSKVLEGGCGTARHVFALDKHGYEVTGIDFAHNTVEQVLKIAPHLNIILGDVRKLPFEDDSFDGYWSIGVIEHFWDGYEDIVNEMRRVIRKDGYLFLTFPQMSALRIKKVRRNLFPLFSHKDTEPAGFYQFALDKENVIDELREKGFELVLKKSRSGFKGIKDESIIFGSYLNSIYKSNSAYNVFLIKIISKIGVWLNYGHTCLLIFKRL